LSFREWVERLRATGKLTEAKKDGVRVQVDADTGTVKVGE